MNKFIVFVDFDGTITLRDTNGRSVIWSGVCSSAGNKTPTCTFTLIANASETANVQ